MIGRYCVKMSENDMYSYFSLGEDDSSDSSVFSFGEAFPKASSVAKPIDKTAAVDELRAEKEADTAKSNAKVRCSNIY